MAFWQAKTKEDYPEMETTSLPSTRVELPSNSVVVPTPKAAASVISMGTVIHGPIQSTGDIHIDGLVIGDVRCDTLVVGKNGEIKGNVISEIATIRGKVSGDVCARMIQLATTGSIEGDLTHAVLIIEEGGQFEGRSIRSADPLASQGNQGSQAEANVSSKPAKKPDGVKAADNDDAENPRSSLSDALGDSFSATA